MSPLKRIRGLRCLSWLTAVTNLEAPPTGSSLRPSMLYTSLKWMMCRVVECGWSFGWLFDWSFGWLFGWVFGWMFGWLFGWLIEGFGWLWEELIEFDVSHLTVISLKLLLIWISWFKLFELSSVLFKSFFPSFSQSFLSDISERSLGMALKYQYFIIEVIYNK